MNKYRDFFRDKRRDGLTVKEIGIAWQLQKTITGTETGTGAGLDPRVPLIRSKPVIKQLTPASTLPKVDLERMSKGRVKKTGVNNRKINKFIVSANDRKNNKVGTLAQIERKVGMSKLTAGSNGDGTYYRLSMN